MGSVVKDDRILRLFYTVTERFETVNRPLP